LQRNGEGEQKDVAETGECGEEVDEVAAEIPAEAENLVVFTPQALPHHGQY